VTIQQLDQLFATHGGRPDAIGNVATWQVAALAADLATTRFLVASSRVHRGPDALAGVEGVRAASVDAWEEERWQSFRPLAETVAVTPRLTRIGAFADRNATPALVPILGSRGLVLAAAGHSLDRARASTEGLLLRFLAALPPGRVRFTLVDHLNKGGAFASLLKLHKSLLGDMVWHEEAQIADVMRGLIDHMSIVIQKYLTNQYADIEAYNAAAGELVEAYRILAISDFPAGFDRARAEQVVSIARNGPRCGVYVVLTVDTAAPVPHGFKLAELYRNATVLTAEGDGFRFDHPVLRRALVELDPTPPKAAVDAIVEPISKGATRLGPVKVDFRRFAPTELWQESTADGVQVPIGRRGARDIQLFEVGRPQGIAHHALIAGKTGLGKTVLLHALVLQLALRYSPEELQLYLVDFKVGVEFEPYRRLPHVRVLAIESEREFGLSVLEGLRAELNRRGELFKRDGVSGLAAFRTSTGERMPRIIAVIDEFQQFFESSDRLASQARLILDDLARRGRSFGIHLVLCTQTISSSSPQALEPSTLSQIGLRIALQLEELDSFRILARDNAAAYHLERPGEAIYNDKAGHVGGNSRFQVSFIDSAERTAYLDELSRRSELRPLVFEGNRPASIDRNRPLAALASTPPQTSPPALHLYLGEPATLEVQHTAFRLRRQSRSSLIAVGQSESELLAVFISAMVSFSLALPPGRARIEVLNLLNVDDPLHERLESMRGRGGIRIGGRRHVTGVIKTMAEIMDSRLADHDGPPPDNTPTLLAVFGLQRARELQKEGHTAPEAARTVSRILRAGPDVGVHALLAVDTCAGFLRCLESKDLAEIDGRIALSGSDSAKVLGDHTLNFRSKPHFGVLFEPDTPDMLKKFKLYDLTGLIDWCHTHISGR